MFILASFSKEDRQKVRSFKLKMVEKYIHHSLADNTDEVLVAKPHLKNHSITVKAVISQQKGMISNEDYNYEPEFLKENNGIAASNAVSYPAKEKEGSIGVLSDKEEDRLSDNFFTVDVSQKEEGDRTAYLEYDLFGLASHQSVSRSVNHNIAIGGEIIVPNSQWTHQKEHISNVLYGKTNTILFTVPGQGIKYKVKNLKIVFEKEKNPVLPIYSLLSGDKLYVKGSYPRSMSLQIDNEEIPLQKGEFEKMLTLTADEKSKGLFSITENGNKTTYKLPQDTRSYKTIESHYFNTKCILITNDQELSIDYEKANVAIPKGSSAAAYIELLKLRSKDFPHTSQGLKNVTLENTGYRLSLISGKLSKKVKITIPYDEKRLGQLHATDIKIFRFDYEKKQWIAEASAVVDTRTKTVSAEADGNGDYISGIISVPESPQINALVPTAISGLKTADPAAGLQFMAPPAANSSGSASTSYPIEIPAGVQGMAPKISVAYNSASGNGWMGEGWNVSGVSEITLDTRWGTPPFDPSYESEIYLLDGEMLMYEGDYLPHRHTNGNGAMDVARQARNTSGKKNFYLRKNNGFVRIERYGTDPKTYTWVVTGTDGTKKILRR
ncbi:SpvB/TcaC N-terminal domain-containing protein [Chryseobacterium hagamense]|uniref:Uncharacterized protein n=1 Tax=Chryseobacterium hagamense TaxID=395935 RepID=A0A511YQS5_9FLAO|nr:SpvB/TcaC N-terminal domain-containing protein [Chryseobacterium hagamense]GEN77550.1 hypothetical protein CHA01nite_32900 [Chryseobacterium hagamense]